ncbi:hypothetical protein MCOR02_005356 [Pyricularia oryzae]|nr:hypothetical protein MCOR02_005356 [Pyricularia oryzae]
MLGRLLERRVQEARVGAAKRPRPVNAQTKPGRAYTRLRRGHRLREVKGRLHILQRLDLLSSDGRRIDEGKACEAGVDQREDAGVVVGRWRVMARRASELLHGGHRGCAKVAL